MIVWGGQNSGGLLNTGGRYCALSGTASPTPTPTPTSTATASYATATATATFTPTPTPILQPQLRLRQLYSNSQTHCDSQATPTATFYSNSNTRLRQPQLRPYNNHYTNPTATATPLQPPHQHLLQLQHRLRLLQPPRRPRSPPLMILTATANQTMFSTMRARAKRLSGT